MCYAHVVDGTWLTPIWFNLDASARGDFRPTMEDACRATACSLRLAPPVITHWVANMVREVRFSMQECTSLIVGASAFLFVDHTAEAEEKLRSKARLRDNTMSGNMRPSMAESSQILYVDSIPHHVE